MKTITITDDIYQYLLLNSKEIGEDASSILRRLLKLKENATTAASAPAGSMSALDELLVSHSFRYATGVVGKFLAILSWLHKKHPGEFDKITAVRGRRVYFAKDAKTLEDSGRNVNPKQIPECKYWVITTSPTLLKQQMLSQAMEIFGYNGEEIERACEAIAV